MKKTYRITGSFILTAEVTIETEGDEQDLWEAALKLSDELEDNAIFENFEFKSANYRLMNDWEDQKKLSVGNNLVNATPFAFDDLESINIEEVAE